MNTILVLVLAFTLPLLLVLKALAPAICLLAGRTIGWRLRKRTQNTRDLLLARVNKERQEYERQTEDKHTTLDDEWEKIEKSRRSSNNGKDGDDEDNADWTGIVGFFHPFWSARDLALQ